MVALADREQTCMEIVTQTGYDRSAVRQILQRLRQQGDVVLRPYRSSGHGQVEYIYTLRPGLLLLNGTTFCNAAPEPTEGDWYKGSVTSGEIWLNVRFSGKGKYQGSTVAYSQGPVSPLRLQPEEPDGEEFYYSFHLATITADHEAIQYALGSIQIPVHGGSNYPYGPA